VPATTSRAVWQGGLRELTAPVLLVLDDLHRLDAQEARNRPLAKLLAGVGDGQRVLQELEDQNAFVTSVDEDRSWFRYHHLLSDLLRLGLRREAPHEPEALHRTAARWCSISARRGDTGLVGAAVETLVGRSEQTFIGVIVDADTVYGVEDPGIRLKGATLD
jgi:ATP/maltotriose-dependent transcriptional regulator MalT